MKKLLQVILACSALSANAQTKAKSPVLEDVKVALDWTPNTNHIGLYAAKELGYFKDVGLNVIFLQQSQTNATTLIGTSKADFGISFMSDMYKARAKAIPVKAIAAIIQSNTACFAWRTSSGIKTVKDWEGKRYGGWGSPEEEATLKFIMEKNGADFSKLKIVTTGISDFIPSTEKNADFMWVYMGWGGIEARLAGIAFDTLCAKDIDPVFDKPSPLIITSESLIKSNPALIKRFMRAVTKGYELAVSNPKAASDALLKQVPELKKDLVYASTDFLAPLYKGSSPKWGVIRSDIWEIVAKWMFERNLIKRVEPAAVYYTNEFLP